MLATCRSLHRAGYEVTAASSTALAAAQWSRSCSRRLRLADARESSSRFVEQLREELTSRPYSTLIAGSDSALLAVSQLRGRLETFTTLGLPSPSIVERVMHRECLSRAAEQVGMPSATSIRCANIEEALAAAAQLGFPVALKSVDAAESRAQSVESVPKGQVVSSAAELATAAALFKGDMLIQRWIAGEVVSLGGVFAEGRLLGIATSRYLRMWPPESGSVASSVSIAPPPELLEAVRRLMLVIGWQGIFELELIQSGPATFVPIDLNPRPYGSMALAEAAGVPLAALWCDWLLGRRRSHVHALPGQTDTRTPRDPSSTSATLLSRTDVRYRWEDGDFRHLVSQLCRGRYRIVLRALRPRRRVTHAHFQRADPLPLLARVAYLGKRAIVGPEAVSSP